MKRQGACTRSLEREEGQTWFIYYRVFADAAVPSVLRKGVDTASNLNGEERAGDHEHSRAQQVPGRSLREAAASSGRCVRLFADAMLEVGCDHPNGLQLPRR